MANLDDLTATLTAMKETIETWYNEKIAKCDEDQTTEEAKVEETYPGDEYEDVRTEKLDSISTKFSAKKDKILEKYNEKIAAAEEDVNNKISEFETKKAEEEEAKAQAILDQESAAVTAKADFAASL